MAQPGPQTNPQFRDAARFAAGRLARFEPRGRVMNGRVRKSGQPGTIFGLVSRLLRRG